MRINGETYVPWDNFKTQLEVANLFRAALERIAANGCINENKTCADMDADKWCSGCIANNALKWQSE